MPYRLGGTVYQTREEAQAAVIPFIRQIQRATAQGRAEPGLTAAQRRMVNDWEAILEAEEEEANARNAHNAMYGNNNNGNWGNQQGEWNQQMNGPQPNFMEEAWLAQQQVPLPNIPLHNIPNMGPINVEEGTQNHISTNTVEEGNALVNFRGTGPKFESEFGYFYKPNTVKHLATHPRTREPIQNYRRRTAHIVPKKNNKQNGSPKARKSRKNRKSRRTSRK